MVKKIAIYVEGGSKVNDINLRRGFGIFFSSIKEKASKQTLRFSVVPCGDQARTIKDFNIAVKNDKESIPLLLVDSDQPLPKKGIDYQAILKEKNNQVTLLSVKPDQIHFMVQVMETWLLADKEALKNHYGAQFKDRKLPQNSDIEAIPKADVLKGLKAATKACQTGEYHKINHAVELLGKIDAAKVRKASFYCNRLFEVLEKKVKEQ